jgi:hypothetical protein
MVHTFTVHYGILHGTLWELKDCANLWYSELPRNQKIVPQRFFIKIKIKNSKGCLFFQDPGFCNLWAHDLVQCSIRSLTNHRYTILSIKGSKSATTPMHWSVKNGHCTCEYPVEAFGLWMRMLLNSSDCYEGAARESMHKEQLVIFE